MPNYRARELRWNMTMGERRLWALLRRKRIAGYRFRRQATLDPYIADFFCPKARLVVELDGVTHSTDEEVLRDEKRTRWLEAHGCHVIRFWNREVFERPREVMDAICRALEECPPSGPLGHLPPQGGKKE
jgi:very-short-patch-repair endonuclease